MKLIIAGSRDLPCTDEYLRKTIDIEARRFDQFPTLVISGHARGVDQAGEEWAQDSGVQCMVVAADWDTYGKAAGPIRNGQMAERADALLAIWDGKSRGTRDMIRRAVDSGLDVRVRTLAVDVE